MEPVAEIPLPPHRGTGGFDHGAVDPTTDRLYVAHTANDTVEVVDLARRRHLRSLEGTRGVAGVWVDREDRLLFVSHRAEDAASIYRLDADGERRLARVRTGARPNGLAYDRTHRTLLVAGVGDPRAPDGGPTLSFFEADSGRSLGRLAVPGRTRWALFHEPSRAFFVNVADPASIVVVDADELGRIARTLPVPAVGPHGLEQDPRSGRLYCAADDGQLLSVAPREGTIAPVARLSGPPDVLWADPDRRRLYAAVGEPGVVDVFDLSDSGGRSLGRISTELGAHTLTVDPTRGEVHVFLPGSCVDRVFAPP